MEKKTMNINEKLRHLQQKLSAPKSLYNKFANFHYRSCEAITEAVKPLLAEVELALTINDSIELIGDRYYIKAVVTLRDDGEKTITATAYARESLDKKGMDSAQITGAASSYARKYALNGLLLIDDNKDPDGDEGEKDDKKKKTPKPPKKTKKNTVALDAICKKLQESLPESKLIDKNSVAAIFYGQYGKYPANTNQTGAAAAWLIGLKQEDSWTKPKQAEEKDYVKNLSSPKHS